MSPLDLRGALGLGGRGAVLRAEGAPSAAFSNGGSPGGGDRPPTFGAVIPLKEVIRLLGLNGFVGGLGMHRI